MHGARCRGVGGGRLGLPRAGEREGVEAAECGVHGLVGSGEEEADLRDHALLKGYKATLEPYRFFLLFFLFTRLFVPLFFAAGEAGARGRGGGKRGGAGDVNLEVLEEEGVGHGFPNVAVMHDLPFRFLVLLLVVMACGSLLPSRSGAGLAFFSMALPVRDLACRIAVRYRLAASTRPHIALTEAVSAFHHRGCLVGCIGRKTHSRYVVSLL